MTLDAARKAVLNTTELLEAIIVRLPLKNIFILQQVNRQFHDLIRSSVQVQQRLFIRPCLAKESWLRNPPKSGEWWSSPPRYEYVRAGKDEKSEAGQFYTPTILCSLPEIEYTGPKRRSRPGESTVEAMTVEMSSLASRPGSWQAMQLTDPPCTEARIAVKFSFDTRRGEVSLDRSRGELSTREVIAVSSVEGITLGQLRTVATEFKHDIWQKRYHSWGVMPWKEAIGYTSIASMIKERGDSARLLRLDIEVELSGMVFPTAREWETVNRRVNPGP